MDPGAWIAIAAVCLAAGSLGVTVLTNSGNVKRSELTLRDDARAGYVEEVKAELDLFRQKFSDAEHHMRTCEEDLRRNTQELNVLKGQNFALMQSLLPKTPLVMIHPDGSVT
jgi:hypothetical protein